MYDLKLLLFIIMIINTLLLCKSFLTNLLINIYYVKYIFINLINQLKYIMTLKDKNGMIYS